VQALGGDIRQSAGINGGKIMTKKPKGIERTGDHSPEELEDAVFVWWQNLLAEVDTVAGALRRFEGKPGYEFAADMGNRVGMLVDRLSSEAPSPRLLATPDLLALLRGGKGGAA
jgi:uncharacterized membrane protein YfbV (UPF0208 family)